MTLPAAADGPDVTVDDIVSVAHWGFADGKQAYSFGIRACNRGDAPVDWDATSAAHPVVVHNMYRLANGRLEQIGMSWAVHEFCALQMACDGCEPAPSCAQLGAGCADESSASIMGQTLFFGPRSEVNASTGMFTMPHGVPGGGDPPVLQGRLVVADEDLDPALNKSAVYLLELMYVAADDAAAGNGGNNSAWRSCTVTDDGDGGFDLNLLGFTHHMEEPMVAWRNLVPNVSFVRADAPNDGRYLVGVEVTPAGSQWVYDYAIANKSSHRSARGVVVETTATAAITNLGFHDVDYHSGEPYAATDWPGEIGAGEVRWETDSFDVDPNANALRWGTLYNVRFWSDTPPSPTRVRLLPYRDAEAGDDFVEVLLPGPRGCPVDVDGSGDVGVDDLISVLASWGECPEQEYCPTDIVGNGATDVGDLLAILDAWGSDC